MKNNGWKIIENHDQIIEEEKEIWYEKIGEMLMDIYDKYCNEKENKN